MLHIFSVLPHLLSLFKVIYVSDTFGLYALKEIKESVHLPFPFGRIVSSYVLVY